MLTAALVHKQPFHPPKVRLAVSPVLRPKLKLGGAHDEAEQQADRIAARVLRGKSPFGPDASPTSPNTLDNHSALRRILSPVENPEPLNQSVEEEQTLPESLESEVVSLQTGGIPLPPPIRAEMEGRFGMDLGTVRLHTDGNAARLNEILHARAFTSGEHIAFNAGAFQPESESGRFLLAHELAHVAQHRGEAGSVENAPVRRGFWSDLYNSAATTLGDIADWAIDRVREFGWRLLESISPEFARTVRSIVDEGLLSWLGRQVARAWDGFIGTLRSLVPFDGPRQLIDFFAGLVERAAGIAAALASGRCEPLMQAVDDIKTFVVETAGVAWNRLTEFLQPVGEFFSDLWNQFGAPAVQWLREFGGEVWEGIQDLGRRFWEWIRPVREAASRVWNWFKDMLFGSSEGEDSTGSQGGVVGWISRKAGEAWDWVKERTRPVWQPVAAFAGQVAELLPPAFIREMGEQARQLSSELDTAAAGMDGGEGVPEARETLASVLPSVQNIIGAIRRVIVNAGQWLSGQIAGIGALVTGLIGRLRANTLLSWLAGALVWLEEGLNTLLSWARDKVGALFNWLVQGFDALSPFLELVAETVRKVIAIAGDLLQLPLLVLNAIWQRVPRCIREPVENFIKNQILARIPVFGQFFTDPELWPRVQRTALDILRRIFVDGDIAGAAWAFFQAVLRILNVPAQLVVQILAKAAGAIGSILTDPIGFLVNMLRAMGAGFTGFFDNIGTHLLSGFTNWLFATVREAGINPPADFSLRSVLGFVLEVLGVSVENVFVRLGRRISPAMVTRLRSMLEVATGVWSFVATLVNEGVAGLWRELRERLSNLWDTVVQGVVGFITERVIGWASRWLLSLLDVTGIMPVINTLIAIYRAIESFMQYLRQMLEIVSRVLDGIGGIARGAIGEAAGFVESALAGALPIAIGFLANQAGLGRLSQRLREILGGLRGRVEGAIDWMIDRALRMGRSVLDLLRRGASAVRSAASRVGAWAAGLLGIERRFTARNGESHRLYFREQRDSLRLMMASEEDTYEGHMQRIHVTPGTPMESRKNRAMACAREIDQMIASRRRTTTGDDRVRDQTAEFTAKLQELSDITRELMSDETSGPLPVTPVPAYGPLHNGFATRMQVQPLTRLGVPGTGVQADHPTYRSLLKRTETPGGRSYYIAGHLLNNNVHGSGTTWSNLTPIRQATNQAHEREVESKVKRATDADAILGYTVDVDYGRRDLTKNSALLREVLGYADGSGNLPQDMAVKREVLMAEQALPGRLVCTVRKVDANGEEDRSFSDAMTNHPVENVIQEDSLDQYYVQGADYDAEGEFAALRTDAQNALGATPALTWTAFRNEGRSSRIRRLESVNAERVATLRAIFRDHHLARLFQDEQRAVAALTESQTWNAFIRNRVVYETNRAEDERLSDAQISQLHAAFDARCVELRAQRTEAVLAMVQNLAEEEPWDGFRRRNHIYASEGGLTSAQVERIRHAFGEQMSRLSPASANEGVGH